LSFRKSFFLLFGGSLCGRRFFVAKAFLKFEEGRVSACLYGKRVSALLREYPTPNVTSLEYGNSRGASRGKRFGF